MKKIRLFDGIFPAELGKMRECLNAREKDFDAGNTLIAYGSRDTRLGVLLRGEAELIRFDMDGHRNILRHIKQGEPFGNIFVFSTYSDEIELISLTPCTVLFFDFEQLLKRCANACECHSRLVYNIIQIQSQNMMELSQRIDILSQRTTRAKLLAYFEMLAREEKSPVFTLPISQAALSDYLFIDRSAMQRELKNMREEGIISTNGRKMTLHRNSQTLNEY